MKRVIGTVLILSGLFVFGVNRVHADTSAPAATGAAQPTALTEVQHTIDEVVRIAQTMAGKEQTKERRIKLREVINPRFDFAEMSKRSLGSNWAQINSEQQKAFTDIFSELLARTYLSKIETVKPGMVKMDSEKLDFPRSSVFFIARM